MTPSPGHIEKQETMRRLLLVNKLEWDDLATVDPFWSILSDPTKRFSKWDVGEFFDTGKKEVEEILDKARSLGFPAVKGRALDFGCGIGRVTRALARHFGECHGVDISEEMISIAKRLNGDMSNCEFIVNVSDTLGIFPDNYFDMVYSNIVLQHLPHRNQIELYILEFIRVLVPTGLLVFQLPNWIPLRIRIQLRRRLYLLLRELGADADFLYTRLGLHPIRMNFLGEREVVTLLEGRGGRVLHMRRSGREGKSFQNCTYFVSK